jgi:DNA-binding NarL/FixJ family response regulator/AraC-like DNA-binding protein
MRSDISTIALMDIPASRSGVMKILIADDESLARSTLRSMLQELQLPLELLEDATNGEEMVELVRRYRPHLVFVDIKMPKLNGLEAIKNARMFAPDTRWFILTGFSEFSYAREALRMGVSDYLLKPVEPEALRTVMTGVVKENSKRLVALNKQFERDIASIYHGLSSIKQEDSDSLLRRAHFIGAIFYIDSFLTETEKAERQGNFLGNVQAIIDALITFEGRRALFALPGGEIALVGAWETEHEAPGEQLSYRCLYQVEQLLSRYQDQSFCVTILQTPVCLSYDELYERLNWLQKFSTLRSMYGIGKKLHIKELSHYAARSRIVEMSMLLSKLSHYYRERMYVHYMHTIDHLVQAFSLGVDYGSKKGAANFLCHTLPCRLTPEQDIVEWKRELQACGEELLLVQPKKDTRDIVAQVNLFIEQNFASDISIAQIAEKLHMTPNYLSALFHKRIGTTFMKYLTKIRMLRAKELLADPDMQVQQVAEQVGYYSVRHFTKVFTAFYGHYPSEQRKRHQ